MRIKNYIKQSWIIESFSFETRLFIMYAQYHDYNVSFNKSDKNKK